MVLAVVVFRQWIFPGSKAIGREVLLDEIVGYMTHGVAVDPDSPKS
jgi:hypothetical protein